MCVCLRKCTFEINKIVSWAYWWWRSTRGYWVSEMTAHFVCKPSSSIVFPSTIFPVNVSFPPGVFHNNSPMTIDAEQTCGKITVIKRELQAERYLLCFKEHARVHTSTPTFKWVKSQAHIQANSLKSAGVRHCFFIFWAAVSESVSCLSYLQSNFWFVTWVKVLFTMANWFG